MKDAGNAEVLGTWALVRPGRTWAYYEQPGGRGAEVPVALIAAAEQRGREQADGVAAELLADAFTARAEWEALAVAAVRALRDGRCATCLVWYSRPLPKNLKCLRCKEVSGVFAMPAAQRIAEVPR